MTTPIRRLPSAKAIQIHWGPRLVAWGKADSTVEVLEEPGWCFACGMLAHASSGGAVTPERAHIRARSRGGADDPENLHLLCRECHRASEFLEFADYWHWFHERNALDVALQLAGQRGVNLSRLLFP